MQVPQNAHDAPLALAIRCHSYPRNTAGSWKNVRTQAGRIAKDVRHRGSTFFQDQDPCANLAVQRCSLPSHLFSITRNETTSINEAPQVLWAQSKDETSTSQSSGWPERAFNSFNTHAIRVKKVNNTASLSSSNVLLNTSIRHNGPVSSQIPELEQDHIRLPGGREAAQKTKAARTSIADGRVLLQLFESSILVFDRP